MGGSVLDGSADHSVTHCRCSAWYVPCELTRSLLVCVCVLVYVRVDRTQLLAGKVVEVGVQYGDADACRYTRIRLVSPFAKPFFPCVASFV